MHFCMEHECHDDYLEMLLHGQELLMKEVHDMAVTVAQLKADFDRTMTDIKAAFARFQASLDANTLDPQALQDLDDAINGADADANAEDPAPVDTTPPADGDTGETAA